MSTICEYCGDEIGEVFEIIEADEETYSKVCEDCFREQQNEDGVAESRKKK